MRLSLRFDQPRLADELDRLTKLRDFHPMDNQLSLTHFENSEDPLYDGVGSLFRPHRPASAPTDEAAYSIFHRDLRDWYLHEVYTQVRQFADGAVGRVRLIRLGPKSCMSLHKDVNFRLHVPIVSNPQCFMIFENYGFFHLAADGSAYLTDTLGRHTVMNGSDSPRIHMVFSLTGDPALYRDMMSHNPDVAS
ncbi:MAG TPA: aspartyl/asparaginyl beta-hydroxylase domain-containing protein [Bdellovibrionales bacterium]|nr:aspartyl/asparaginyl beta-hydroxylase domain-containing protein [Bdellovibrionales bacterium]